MSLKMLFKTILEYFKNYFSGEIVHWELSGGLYTVLPADRGRKNVRRTFKKRTPEGKKTYKKRTPSFIIIH